MQDWIVTNVRVQGGSSHFRRAFTENKDLTLSSGGIIHESQSAYDLMMAKGCITIPTLADGLVTRAYLAMVNLGDANGDHRHWHVFIGLNTTEAYEGGPGTRFIGHLIDTDLHQNAAHLLDVVHGRAALNSASIGILSHNGVVHGKN